jgi:hypothetical protein
VGRSGVQTVKAFLVASQLLCLFALLRSTPKPYRITLAYLLAAIPATLAFRAESTWLHAWYPVLAGPLVFLRFAAGLEILHRQTAGFRYWWRLMGAVFLIAGMLAGLAWWRTPGADGLQSLVDFRRLLQIFSGSVFLVLEGFWTSQGGGLIRRCDRVAAVFAVLACNHGLVSFICGMWTLEAETWARLEWHSWGIDATCYLALTAVFLSARQFWQRRP